MPDKRMNGVPKGRQVISGPIGTRMPRDRLMYIELKTGHQDNGPAWIGRVKFSKSGHTVYFNGRALKRSGGQGVEGNHYDVETGEEYWVSGVKKAGSDRHSVGSGKIKIDVRVLEEYLAIVGRDQLDTSRFEVCTDIVDTDVEQFHQMENKRLL